MIALQITSMKQFMSQLLAGDTFDVFLLEEATLTTAFTIQIDGHRLCTSARQSDSTRVAAKDGGIIGHGNRGTVGGGRLGDVGLVDGEAIAAASQINCA